MKEKEITATFDIEKETKNTIKFKECVADDEECREIIGALYVKKDALERLSFKKGDSIVVTIKKYNVSEALEELEKRVDDSYKQ